MVNLILHKPGVLPENGQKRGERGYDAARPRGNKNKTNTKCLFCGSFSTNHCLRTWTDRTAMAVPTPLAEFSGSSKRSTWADRP